MSRLLCHKPCAYQSFHYEFHSHEHIFKSKILWNLVFDMNLFRIGCLLYYQWSVFRTALYDVYLSCGESGTVLLLEVYDKIILRVKQSNFIRFRMYVKRHTVSDVCQTDWLDLSTISWCANQHDHSVTGTVYLILMSTIGSVHHKVVNFSFDMRDPFRKKVIWWISYIRQERLGYQYLNLKNILWKISVVGICVLTWFWRVG